MVEVESLQDESVMLYFLSMDVHKKDHPDNLAPYARTSTLT